MATDKTKSKFDFLPILYRKIDLMKWVDIKKKPKKGQKVWVCDADHFGIAEYELPAVFDGKRFQMKDHEIVGHSYWKPRR